MSPNFAPWADDCGCAAVMVRSADGLITVRMQRTQDGIFVQQEQVLRRSRAGRVVQVTRFSSIDDFRRWCHADMARFEDPHIAAGLIRHADDLFSDTAVTTGAR